jgi:Putative Flp pilus-assembly TadE/G-like/von Willebrand factor type A domain
MRKLNQKGSVLIFLTLAFALLGTFIGFAVDFGRAYLEKARMSRLVDAAALAAAKTLQGQAGFEDEATRAACDSMEMNGAPVVMNGTACVSTNSNATFPVTFFDAPVQGGPPIRHVRVEGHEPMPTTFLRFLGWMVPGDFSKIDVAAAAEAGPERPVDLMLILDRSGSMSISVGGQTKLAMLKTAVNAFLDQKFTGNDRIGMLSFGYRGCGNSSGTDDLAAITCSPDVPLGDATSSFISTLKTKVNALQAPGATLTNTMEALRTARPAMAAVFNDPNRALSRKAVLLVTDGKPTVMRIDNDPKCHQDPFNNNSVSGWSGGTFNSGCLQGATSTSGSSAFRLTLSAGSQANHNSSTLFQHVESCTRSLSSCAGTNGAMYEANFLRNCGTGNSSCTAGGEHDVLVFAIGIGAINNSQPNASFDKHAKCLLSRIANANDILNTGTNTLETMGSVCTNPQTPPNTSDGDTYADLRDGCGSAPCTINTTQEKGKVYIVDTNGNVPAQLQQVFNEIAALLKLRLTL